MCSKADKAGNSGLSFIRFKAALGPFAAAHDRFTAAVRIDAIHIDLIGTDHPVDMNKARISTLCGDLLGAEIGAIDKAF